MPTLVRGALLRSRAPCWARRWVVPGAKAASRWSHRPQPLCPGTGCALQEPQQTLWPPFLRSCGLTGWRPTPCAAARSPLRMQKTLLRQPPHPPARGRHLPGAPRRGATGGSTPGGGGGGGARKMFVPGARRRGQGGGPGGSPRARRGRGGVAPRGPGCGSGPPGRPPPGPPPAGTATSPDTSRTCGHKASTNMPGSSWTSKPRSMGCPSHTLPCGAPRDRASAASASSPSRATIRELRSITTTSCHCN